MHGQQGSASLETDPFLQCQGVSGAAVKEFIRSMCALVTYVLMIYALMLVCALVIYEEFFSTQKNACRISHWKLKRQE